METVAGHRRFSIRSTKRESLADYYGNFSLSPSLLLCYVYRYRYIHQLSSLDYVNLMNTGKSMLAYLNGSIIKPCKLQEVDSVGLIKSPVVRIVVFIIGYHDLSLIDDALVVISFNSLFQIEAL